MPLKAIVTKLDEVPEPARAFYVEREGRFVLDTDLHDNVSRLERSIEKERTDRTMTVAEIEKLKKQFQGIDPEKAREEHKKLQELSDQQLLTAGEHDKLFEQKTERMRADHENQISAFKKSTEQLGAEREALNGRLSELLIDNAIRQAGPKVGLRDEAVDDAVLLGRTIYRLKDGEPVPFRGQDVIYGKDATKPMPIEEWLGSLIPVKVHWFKPSTGSGAETSRGTSLIGNTLRISQEEARDPQRYRAAKEAAHKAGAQLQIVGA